MSEEIQRLQLLQRCRKRAADEPTHSLRRIFDTETQSSGSAAAGAATPSYERRVCRHRKFYVGLQTP